MPFSVSVFRVKLGSAADSPCSLGRDSNSIKRAMPGPVLPNAAVRGNEGYSDGKCSPKSMPKDLRSPGRQVMGRKTVEV